MQRALRINPEAQNLWLQYFRLEFSYVEKLMGRREILGLEEEEQGGGGGAATAAGRDSMDIPELEAEEGQSGGPSFNAVKKAAVAAAAAGGDGATVGGDGSARPAPVMNDTARRFYRGAVPMAVFRAAIKAVPADVGFRAGFLRCCAVDFPTLAAEAARAVLASIERDFPESCEAWELRASYPLLVAEGRGGGGVKGGGGGGDGLGPAGRESVATFERAVEAVGAADPEVWVRYAAFLRGRLEACEEREERRRTGGGGKKRKGSSMAESPVPAPAAAAAAALTARLKDVLARAVDIHLLTAASDASDSSTGTMGGSSSTTTVVAAAIAARKERGGASLLATRGVSTSAAELEAAARRRAEDAREALSAGLADACLSLGESEEALSALRSATEALPRRPGPWLRRAALERRLAAVSGGGGGDDGVGSGNSAAAGAKQRRLAGAGSGSVGSSGSGGSAGGSDASVAATATLRAGLKAVPPTAPGYPALWRELIASLVASGGGGAGKRNAVAAAFRGAVEACNPAAGGEGGGNPDPAGTAQGEFLAGYIRWAAAVEGVDAARRALQWARRSFLLSGTGAAAAYNEAIELERALGEAGGSGGGRAKRVRELFEVRIVVSPRYWLVVFVVCFMCVPIVSEKCVTFCCRLFWELFSDGLCACFCRRHFNCNDAFFFAHAWTASG